MTMKEITFIRQDNREASSDKENSNYGDHFEKIARPIRGRVDRR